MIDIKSNGSKWAGQDPDDLGALFEMLATVPLDRVFEKYGNFINPHPEFIERIGEGYRHTFVPCESPYGDLEVTAFGGNFFGVSHVFQIYTDEPDLIERLTVAIRENQRRPDYLAQREP